MFKKITSAVITFVTIVSLVIPAYATSTPACEEHICNASTDVCVSTVDFQSKPERIIEVTSEAETYNYVLDPNYRYTFIWEVPYLKRSVCYMCGSSTMGTIRVKTQYGSDSKMCPIALSGAYSDLFNTWHTKTHDRCTACGYQSEGYNLVVTYTSRCFNDGNPSENGEWEVRAEYTPAAGYDVHQSLNWWLYYSYN